jgi:hypothetical protein
MLSLPASAQIACWLNAWLASRESADAVIAGCHGRDGVAEFVGPEPGTRMSPALLLGELRRWRVRRVSCALPAPGDPVGLGGPAAFNADVIDAGHGVVLHGCDLGLVPTVAGDITTWRLTEAHPPTYLASVSEADRALRAALTEAADQLAQLDVASWQPDVADALLEVRRAAPRPEPVPYSSDRAARLAHDALRAAGIVALASRGDGGAVSASESARRKAALQPLDRAARAGVVAATSSLDGR